MTLRIIFIAATIILGTAVAVAINMIWKRALVRSVAAPFKPKKAVSTKDTLILTMLEDVMDGDARPCYVITGNLYSISLLPCTFNFHHSDLSIILLFLLLTLNRPCSSRQSYCLRKRGVLFVYEILQGWYRGAELQVSAGSKHGQERREEDSRCYQRKERCITAAPQLQERWHHIYQPSEWILLSAFFHWTFRRNINPNNCIYTNEMNTVFPVSTFQRCGWRDVLLRCTEADRH
jgi:hypothetical protein